MKKPPYTAVPHEIIDTHLPDMTCGELKVLLVLVRATYGWHRDTKTLSMSELSQKTGLSRGSCCDAVTSLEERGLLSKTKQKSEDGGNSSTTYDLRFDDDPVRPAEQGGVRPTEQGVRPAEQPLFGEPNSIRNKENKLKENTPKESPTPSETETAPISFEDFLFRWNRHAGFKKPNKALKEKARLKWDTDPLTSDEADAVLDGYYTSDLAKQEGYPILGCLSNPRSWITSPHYTISVWNPPLEVHQPPTNSTAPAAASMAAIPEEPRIDIYAEWKAAVPGDRSERDIGRDAIAAQRLTELDDDFMDQREAIFAMAGKIHRIQGAGASWMTFNWIFRKKDGSSIPNWKKILTEFASMAQPKSESGQKKERNLLEEAEQYRREQALRGY